MGRQNDTSHTNDIRPRVRGQTHARGESERATCVGLSIREIEPPVAFGDRILFTSEDGDTFVVRAGPTHEIIRTNSLDEPVFASPALANGMVYIRGERHLYAIK